MAVNPGYNVLLLISGEATAMTDEGMTLSSGKTYYTTDADKNIWDPDGTFVIEDSTVVVDPSNYTLDPLLGKVTFADAYTVNGAVTVTGNYLPVFSISTARGYSGNFSRQMLDDTVFGDDAVSRKQGLFDATGTIERLDEGLVDYDTGGSSGQTIWDGLSNDTWKVIEIYEDADSDKVWRICTQFESNEIASAPDALTTGALQWQGRLGTAITRSFSYGDPTA